MIGDKHRDELVEYVKRYAPISLPAGLHHDMMLLPEQSQFVQHAIEAWAIVEQLRANPPNEVAQIIIYHDNPDFGGPNSVVETDFDAFDDRRQRFTGATVLEALRAALAAKKANA